jgi:thiamine pyrophosphokinase
MPNKKNRCVIITPFLNGPINEAYAFEEGDFLIAVDGGYAVAEAAGLRPDLVMGDFDSFPLERLSAFPQDKIIKHPAEKDDTDVMLAIKTGFSLGMTDFRIIGGIGGRLDHTVGNLQALSYCLSRGGSAWIDDGPNKATMTDAAEFLLPFREGCYFSLFSWSESCVGVRARGAKYPVGGATLTNSFPLGVSNEFSGGDVIITKESGRLLIITARKD